MIFNCGKTWEQKWKEKEERLTNWYNKPIVKRQVNNENL